MSTAAARRSQTKKQWASRASLAPCLATLALSAVACATSSGAAQTPATAVAFTASATEVDAYDFLEVAATVEHARVRNPFTDAVVTGQFARVGDPPTRVEGFSDSQDGRVFRVRFMPSAPGDYTYVVHYDEASGAASATHRGTFRARDGRRRGLVRVDKEHPFHFVWEGTGEHYFWNSTTTYGIAGWDDETMLRNVDRLAALGVNRIRATLIWRVDSGKAWFENVYPTRAFSMLLNPWVAERPLDRAKPGFDVKRFNVAHWQKYERLLRRARDKDMIVSVVFYTDGRRAGTDPFGKAGMGGPDEQRYYRYAISRLAAFSNVMWDVTNEYHLFRTEPWTDLMGALIKEWDPYDHLASVHGHGKFLFRKSPWADFAMYQSWDDAGGHAFMLKNREEQKAAGRPIPQINEEYGYEDHYPVGWGGNKKAPARSADNRRRLAWGMTMAGGYQTTGERADMGTGFAPDTGGGWINGRGDDSMVMLRGYRHIMTFMTSFAWWKAEPRDDLVEEGGAHCLADPGRAYALWMPEGRAVTIKLDPPAAAASAAGASTYRARWFNPRTGVFTDIGAVEGATWTSPAPADREDWAILVER